MARQKAARLTRGDVRAPDASAPAAAKPAHGRKLLAIDTVYNWETIRRRRLEDVVVCRELDGFFAHVWSVHPVATLTTSEEWTPRFGPPVEYRVNERHTFIEGKIGRFAALRRLFAFNFLLAQMLLFVQLYRLIQRERISVIRAGDPLYSGLMSWALARLTGLPFLVRLGTNHDKAYEVLGRPLMPRLFRKRRYERMAERFVLRRADLVACATADYLQFALSSGAREDRATVFPYGNSLDRRHFIPPDERQLDPQLLAELGVRGGAFLLYVGRLTPGKHADHVIRALAELRSRGHDLKVVLAGEGEMRPSLEALASDLQVDSDVIFAGDRPQDWLAQMIPQAVAIVSPVTGRALTEAALGAAPIVAYDADWQSELIQSGETGELVRDGEWNELANGAERFIRDPRYARRMGAAVRSKAMQMFDPQLLNERERQAYQRILLS